MIKIKSYLNKFPLWSMIPHISSGGVRRKQTGKEFIGGELTGLKGKLISEGKQNVLIELSSIGFGLRVNVDVKYLMKSSTKLAVALAI